MRPVVIFLLFSCAATIYCAKTDDETVEVDETVKKVKYDVDGAAGKKKIVKEEEEEEVEEEVEEVEEEPGKKGEKDKKKRKEKDEKIAGADVDTDKPVKDAGKVVKSTSGNVDGTHKKTGTKVDDTKGGIFDGGFFRGLFGDDDDEDED